MEVIYSLIPGMMFFGVLFVIFLVWAVKKGQYEDMEGSANRILLDDDEDMMHHPRDAKAGKAEKSNDPAQAAPGDGSAQP
ncbi:MAG: cytochrome oxidase maturation protein, cbb3-type [Gallionellales bacterium GWA2_60_18]|nr:MAG: cytochrome oxidase maturation protein, cbb3-type [Gallionellales bacterium GWA2_60_18]